MARLLSAQGSCGGTKLFTRLKLCAQSCRMASLCGQQGLVLRADRKSPKPVKTGSQAHLPGPRHVCSQKCLDWKGGGARGVIYTHSPANTHLSFHPPRPNRFHLLKINLGDLRLVEGLTWRWLLGGWLGCQGTGQYANGLSQ